jgi:hypothetical protein
VLIGQNGVIVVDAENPRRTEASNGCEIAKRTRSPSHVIHYSDGDHVNGLAGFPDGLTLIAHQAIE